MSNSARLLNIDEMITLPRLSDARISPDGHWIAFQRSCANWERNAYDREVRVIEADDPTMETSLDGFVASVCPRWSPDGRCLLVVGKRSIEDAASVFLLQWPTRSIVAQISTPPGAFAFDWTPSGDRILCIAPAPRSAVQSEFEERYGRVSVLDEETPSLALWAASTIDGGFRCIFSEKHVSEYACHPKEPLLALTVLPNGSPVVWDQGRIILFDVEETRASEIRCGHGCSAPVWDPEGLRLAFSRLKTPSFVANNEIGIYDTASGTLDAAEPIDEQSHPIAWRKEGLYFLGLERASAHLYRTDPESGSVECVTARQRAFALVEGWGSEGCTFPKTGRVLACVCHTEDAPGEVALIETESGDVRVLTDHVRPIAKNRLPHSEVLAWATEDGEHIEGVLHVPRNWDRVRPRPLIVLLHGGPTALALQAALVDSDWKLSAIAPLVDRGALVLRPNYRGSAGYGERFRAANRFGLGLVNERDVHGGIDDLVARGWVDPERIALTGASHGGYLSAFIGLRSKRFSASIMQCGISDWRLNYACNSQPDWERQYLRGTPWQEPALYAQLSPLDNIGAARTPTLILHGDSDTQAPTANATALYRALRDHGVPARCVLYGATGHGPNRPRELRHHMEEVVGWLDRWLFETADPAGSTPLQSESTTK